MVTGPTEHGIQADVIFVIEGTAVNGAYLNDLKTNYLIPTLEYFSQGGIEDREYVSESTTTLYGIVVYHAADCLPSPCTETLGPYSNPHKLLMVLDKLEMVGGKGESYANIGEGLATGLQCFEDLQQKREPNTASQKHCILICNSPPYQTMIQESFKFAGNTIEQLAGIYQERNISISILSPRKIPALYKLFEKAGGDLQSSQTKNYAKDPRHLVLLRNYNLKERPISPQIGGNVHNTAATTAQIPLSPLQSNDSPNQVQQNIAPSNQQQGPPFRNQAPQNTVTPSMAAPMNAVRPSYNSQIIAAPPNYHPTGVNIATRPRWMRPFITPGATAPANTQGSALIAQLTQPPSSLGLNATAFGQRLDVTGNNVMATNSQQQQQQQLTQQQQQLRLTMQLQQQQQQQQNAQQATMSMTAQPTHSQPGSQLTVSCISQSVPTQVPQTVTASQQAPVSVSSITQQITHPQTQGNVPPSNVQTQQLVSRDRGHIWQGIVEWIEKAKTDSQKQTRHVPCQISLNPKEGDSGELKADTWPDKLLMQLMPKQLIGNIGNIFLKNSKSVLFHPTPCEALESLTKMMTNGFAGCVHFTTAPSSPTCDIKVLILLYTAEKKAYLGFIPNDQTAFVDRLRKVIQQQKTNVTIKQGQVRMPNTGPGNTIPAPMPTTGTQGGILMSQTNTMAMGGGQITQNVVSSNAAPQTLTSSSGPQTQMNMQNSGISGPQSNTGAGGMIGQQRPPFDDIELARHQNLLKIQHLRQTLEAAQQQEAQYKSQLEVNIQQNLELAQQQEMQYKQQLEAQQAQRGLNPAAMSNQQPNTQRLMRPVSTNNLGLRHLLQQPQPQYRQVFGVQVVKRHILRRNRLHRKMLRGSIKLNSHNRKANCRCKCRRRICLFTTYLRRKLKYNIIRTYNIKMAIYLRKYITQCNISSLSRSPIHRSSKNRTELREGFQMLREVRNHHRHHINVRHCPRNVMAQGNEQNVMTESGNIHVGNGPPLPPPLSPQAPWQNHHVRVPWGRPPPIPREGEPAVCPGLPPINMPPPQIRPRGPADGNRSPTQNAMLEQSLNIEYNQIPPYMTKPPPYNAHPLMQSICNPPPPPPLHHQQPRSQHHSQAAQHYQVPISQTYQPPTSCPPWMN